MNRIIREATRTDMPMNMHVMESAKKIMQASGNLRQWGAGYPSESVIAADMGKGGAFVIDTHKDNAIMQHNIVKHGFSYCGIIHLASGDERLAYQKLRVH